MAPRQRLRYRTSNNRTVAYAATARPSSGAGPFLPMNLSTLFLLLALICFILETVGVPNPPRVRLLALGLAFFVASLLVTGTLRTP